MSLYVVGLSWDSGPSENAGDLRACRKAFTRQLKELGQVTAIARSAWLVSTSADDVRPLEEATSALDALPMPYRVVIITIDKCEQCLVTSKGDDPNLRSFTEEVQNHVRNIPRRGWFG